MNLQAVTGPVWLMQPIPYFGEKISGSWIVEPKYDGWRMQIIKCTDGKIKIFGRRLEKNPDWTEKLTYLADIIQPILPNGTILDSELCSDKGRQFIPSLFVKNKKAEPQIFIFDVIFLENQFVGDKPLRVRKELLKKLKFTPPFFPAEYEELHNLEQQIKKFVSKNSEGVVIKEVNSLYEISNSAPVATPYWRKIKI